MIETLVPVGQSATEQLPPGLFTNGTLFDRQGRWAGGDLVRFPYGYPQAMGTWGSLSLSATPPNLVNDVPSGAFAWTASNGLHVICGKHDKIYTIRRNGSPPHTVTDVTPVGLVATAGESNLLAWSFAAFVDDEVLACRNNTFLTTTTSLGVWDAADGGAMVPISAAGTGLRGVFMTPERFVMVLKAGRNIGWASQGTYDQWTPSSTNSAGGMTIPGGSTFITGRAVGNRTLLWSEDDIALLEYIGAPLYYGATPLGAGAGLVGQNCVAVVQNTAYWMGLGGFFKYDGFIQPLACDVADSVFSTSLKRGNAHRWFALVNAPSNEIWWFYGDSGSQYSPNKLVTYNYVNETWSLGTLSRAAGCDAVWHDAGSAEVISPILFDLNGTSVYQHEIAGAAAGAVIESGPFQVGNGDQTALVQRIIPDSRTVGDEITLFSGTYPGEAEVTNGPYTSSGAVPLDARFRARYVRYKQTLTAATSRVGVPRLGVIPSSNR